LCHLAQERGIDVGPILDLACGDGTLAERLAVVASEVVGLDASDHMLDQARARFGRLPGVSFVLGDFRSFELNRQFASIVCASNSLNYVTGPRELSTVFRRVAAHLRPGGLFVFDTITEKGMRALSGLYLHFTSGNGRFALRFSYDAQRRTEKSEAILAEGIEWHRRVPIDLADVQAAADESGLHVDDFFTYARIPGRWALGTYCVFVLSK
jgi:ubiquinone/menaquinone biosynthesis C-methylase UbiE